MGDDGGGGGDSIAADGHGGSAASRLLRTELSEGGGDCEECHGQGDGPGQRHCTWSSPPPLPRLLRRGKSSPPFNVVIVADKSLVNSHQFAMSRG